MPCDSEELAALGLRWEGEVHDGDFAVWPENWAVVMVFKHMMTQWIMAFSGPVGLNYGSLSSVYSVLGVKRKERRDIFPDFRLMERAALECMYEGK